MVRLPRNRQVAHTQRSSLIPYQNHFRVLWSPDAPSTEHKLRPVKQINSGIPACRVLITGNTLPRAPQGIRGVPAFVCHPIRRISNHHINLWQRRQYIQAVAKVERSIADCFLPHRRPPRTSNPFGFRPIWERKFPMFRPASMYSPGILSSSSFCRLFVMLF